MRKEAGIDVTYRVVSDHLGSVRLVINANTGIVAQRMAYDEYGVVMEDTNPRFQPFGYAGGLYDQETGMTKIARLGWNQFDWQSLDCWIFP